MNTEQKNGNEKGSDNSNSSEEDVEGDGEEDFGEKEKVDAGGEEKVEVVNLSEDSSVKTLPVCNGNGMVAGCVFGGICCMLMIAIFCKFRYM